MKKYMSSILVVLLLLSTVGCWDKVEINDRAFVTAIGIDKFEYTELVEKNKKLKEEEKKKQPAEQEKGKKGQGKEEEEQQKKPKKEEPPKKRSDEKSLEGEEVTGIDRPKDESINRYVVSYGFPNLGKMKESLDIGGEDISFVRSVIAETPFDASRDIGTRLPKQLYYGHTKTVILGKELAQDEKMMKEVIEWLERDHQMDRRMYVLIADGKAQDVIKNNTTIDPFLGIYIREVFNNRKRVAGFRYMDLDKVIQAFHNNGDAVLPRIVIAKEENKIAGAAVFHHFRYVGWLGEEETRATLWLENEVKGGTLTVVDQGIHIPFEISSANTDFAYFQNKNGQLVLRLNVRVEGNINSYAYGAEDNLMNDAYLGVLEEKIGQKITDEIKATVEKLQKEFKVDALGFREDIKKNRPNLWHKIKDDWEEEFSSMKVEVIPHIYIRRIGVIK